ncbi:MAG: Rrf2 family transcriptional regulator [Firmicutes bacterium]|nr:Rrf2 family transcriptional regulator [Bacillota bacterium]
MIITRRSDYAMRICRALQDGKIHNVREICETEDIPKAFAYKILREMEQHGIVKSERGNMGGYCLVVDLKDVSIHDIVSITEENLSIVHCMNEECVRNTNDEPCQMHKEMKRVQSVLEKELKSKSISEIISSL